MVRKNQSDRPRGRCIRPHFGCPYCVDAWGWCLRHHMDIKILRWASLRWSYMQYVGRYVRVVAWSMYGAGGLYLLDSGKSSDTLPVHELGWVSVLDQAGLVGAPHVGDACLCHILTFLLHLLPSRTGLWPTSSVYISKLKAPLGYRVFFIRPRSSLYVQDA